MIIQRRKFLTGLLSVFAAPATIVRAEPIDWIPAIPNDIPENWDMRLVRRDVERFRYLSDSSY